MTQTFRKSGPVVMVVSGDAGLQKRAERRRSIEKMLDELSENQAKLDGTSPQVAYARFLQTDLGKQVYAELSELSVDTERASTLPVEVAKLEGSAASATLAKAASIDAQLNDLAKAHSRDRRVDFTRAYVEVLQSDEGRRLYAEQCQLMASVRA